MHCIFYSNEAYVRLQAHLRNIMNVERGLGAGTAVLHDHFNVSKVPCTTTIYNILKQEKCGIEDLEFGLVDRANCPCQLAKLEVRIIKIACHNESSSRPITSPSKPLILTGSPAA